MPQEKFVNLLDAPFSRRGSYLTFANDNHGEDVLGKSTLWLCNCRTMGSMSADLHASNGFRKIKLELIKDGTALPCVISTTPYEVILESEQGSVRFCIGERSLVMCRGENGLALRITPPEAFWLPAAFDLFDGTYLVDFRPTKLLVVPFVGELAMAEKYLEITPDANGVVQLGFEEYFTDPDHRPLPEYPSYEKCVQNVKDDFDGYCERVAPKFNGEFEAGRLHALWQNWSMTVEPDEYSDYKHTMVKMIHSIFEAAFVWQQPLQAMALSKDVKQSWDVMCSGFDHMDKNGRLIDALSYRASPSDGLKPPVHGVALSWLMENCDLSSIPLESKQWVWDRLKKWTEYYFKFRDFDKDGLAEFLHIIETGWEDAPIYNIGFPCASPDINALLAIQMEVLAKLGREIGKPEDECAEWDRRCDNLVKLIIEKLWDGERFFAFNSKTGEKSDAQTIALYFPLLLGDKLPKEIREKCIEYIFSPGKFDTQYGLTSETVDSPYFKGGFTQGSVITPTQFWMAVAFDKCGRRDLSEKVAAAYCKTLRDSGFFHIHNALTGEGDRSLTAFGEKGLFWSAWASGTYIFFGNEYAK